MNYSWTGLAPTQYQVVPAASKILMASFVLSGSFDETITRTRGLLHMQSDQAVASEFQLGAVGMLIVSADALAVGITAIPSPGNDIANDSWFVWVPMLSTIKAADDTTDVGYHTIIDSKAQRVLTEGNVVVVVAENFHATAGLQVAVNFRMLTRFRS